MAKAISRAFLLYLIIESSSVSGLLFHYPPTACRLLHRCDTIGRFSIHGNQQQHPSSLLSLLSATRATTASSLDDLQTELNGEGLGLCHGILHASGVRRLADLQSLTDIQITTMGADALDRRNLLRIVGELNRKTPNHVPDRELSTQIDGAFDKNKKDKNTNNLELEDQQHDFGFAAICSDSTDIFKGQLFTAQQCEQINRMAEYHAYRGTVRDSIIGAGWTNGIYTLTGQHMQCKDVPGMIPATRQLFDDLLNGLYGLYPDRIRPGSIRLESDGEPHLVKYSGRSRGTASHTDNSKYLSITINVALSAEDEYTGGGTYVNELDQTISLRQGEMLVHLGDVEHAGVDITSGVRRILIAFVVCEWEDDDNGVEP